MKICFISAKFSVNSDLLINITIKNKNKNYDYILFTNLECENPNADDGYKIIKIRTITKIKNSASFKRNCCARLQTTKLATRNQSAKYT